MSADFDGGPAPASLDDLTETLSVPDDAGVADVPLEAEDAGPAPDPEA
ncbi:hypothetical protein ACFWNN_22635 [Lentzea sp. NPDC058450]